MTSHIVGPRVIHPLRRPASTTVLARPKPKWCTNPGPQRKDTTDECTKLIMDHIVRKKGDNKHWAKVQPHFEKWAFGEAALETKSNGEDGKEKQVEEEEPEEPKEEEEEPKEEVAE